jgi:hypothetical protein
MRLRVRTAALAFLLKLLVLVPSAQALGPVEVEAEAAGRPIFIQPSPLASLIEALPGMTPDARVHLADLIVAGLAEAYETELATAMQEFQLRGSDRRNLTQWYLATAPMLAELRERQAELREAEVVELHMEAHNQLLLIIDGRPLWAAWPRPAAQRAVEQELASDFCRLHECPEASDAGVPARVVEPSTVSGHWVLAQYRPATWESADGVNCEFQEYSRIGEKVGHCQALVADLHVLAAALRAAQRSGERIAWTHLGLRATRDGLQNITVNEHGDYIGAFVPSLAAALVDWGEARRWLEARVQGRSARATVLRAQGGMT